MGVQGNSETPSRAVIYARLSLDRAGDELGVERQETACRELAARHGFEVVGVHTDNSISATSGAKRLGFEAMLETLESGAASVVLCWHLDRLVRSNRDLARVLDLRHSVHGLAVVPVMGTPIYADDASGRMTAEILAAVGAYESSHLAERQRAKVRQKRESGALPPKIYGYADGGGREPVPVEAAAVKAAFQAFLESETVSAAQRALLAADPAAPASRSAVRVLLTRPAYAGIPSLRGVERPDWPCGWEPLVSIEDFRTVQAVLARPSRRYAKHNRRERSTLGTAIYLCGKCGQGMHRSRRNGQRVYICRNRDHLRRVAAPVDRFVVGLLLARLGMADAQASVLPRSPAPDAAALVERYGSITKRLEVMTNALADGVLDPPTALPAIERLKADRGEIEARLAASSTGADGVPEPHDPLRALLAAPLSAVRTALHALVEITLMPVSGSPKGHPRSLPRPLDLDSVRVRWRESLPAPLFDRHTSGPLDLALLEIGDGFDPATVPEMMAARRIARTSAPVLSEDQRRMIWGALAKYVND